MKILLINKYLYPRGGDALSTIATGSLLASKGHEVILWGMKDPLNPPYRYQEYFVSHVDFNTPMSITQKLVTMGRILYSIEAKTKIEKLIKENKPDIVHLNNFAHQISSSILYVFKKYNIPTVMTMRDYKLVCASYSMLADNKVCEACEGSRYYNVFLKKCFKNSRLKSLIGTIEMYLHHKILHIYDIIDVFISPSMFLRNKLKEMGFKKDIVYLPNFVNVEDFIPSYGFNERSIVYFGRLSKEKGLNVLIDAVKDLKDITLKIIGDGPIRYDLEEKTKKECIKNVHFLGHRTGMELKEEIHKSMFAITPSEWYENNPRSVLEAFALGKPVIGANIGGIPELVKEGETGFLFNPGDVGDLKNKILNLAQDKAKIEEIGLNARRSVEENFNPEKHYYELMKIYGMAIDKHK